MFDGHMITGVYFGIGTSECVLGSWTDGIRYLFFPFASNLGLLLPLPSSSELTLPLLLPSSSVFARTDIRAVGPQDTVVDSRNMEGMGMAGMEGMVEEMEDMGDMRRLVCSFFSVICTSSSGPHSSIPIHPQ